MVEIKVSHFNDVLTEHENMIYYLINKLGIRDPEREFYQEGAIALWKAVETYDESRGKFSSYAYFLIEKALLSLIRKRNRQTKKENACLASLSTEAIQVTTILETSFDPYILNRIKQNLTDNQMKWFTLYVLQDLSIKAIAAKENVTVDAVKNWARHAKPKINRLLTHEYNPISN